MSLEGKVFHGMQLSIDPSKPIGNQFDFILGNFKFDAPSNLYLAESSHGFFGTKLRLRQDVAEIRYYETEFTGLESDLDQNKITHHFFMGDFQKVNELIEIVGVNGIINCHPSDEWLYDKNIVSIFHPNSFLFFREIPCIQNLSGAFFSEFQPKLRPYSGSEDIDDVFKVRFKEWSEGKGKTCLEKLDKAYADYSSNKEKLKQDISSIRQGMFPPNLCMYCNVHIPRNLN